MNLLSVNDLKVHFNIANGMFGYKTLKAVDGISFDLKEGETLSIVGESGCGKSTLGRAVLRLLDKTEGSVIWQGQEIFNMNKKEIKDFRKQAQIIFQDPLASLNPRMTIGSIISEPLITHFPNMSKEEVRKKVEEVMEQVGFLPQMINRYPHEFSGGQNQRIGIARAMILKPKMIVCDEPVSALDVSIQGQIINLLKDLQKKHKLALIFISHDLSVVKYISDRVMVVYLGKVVETGNIEDVYNNPQHPYTQALLSAVPIADPKLERSKKRIILKGDLPSPIDAPSGCVFRTRCPKVFDECSKTTPTIYNITNSHCVNCHLFK